MLEKRGKIRNKLVNFFTMCYEFRLIENITFVKKA